MHDEHVLAAFAIGEEGNPLPIRGEARLTVKSHAAIDQLGFAAFDGKRVNVAEQSKAMVLPSGETSKESQVPSSVVNSILRPGFSGRPFFSSFLSSFFSSFLSWSWAES